MSDGFHGLQAKQDFFFWVWLKQVLALKTVDARLGNKHLNKDLELHALETGKVG
jgi:hypothetical protein